VQADREFVRLVCVYVFNMCIVCWCESRHRPNIRITVLALESAAWLDRFRFAFVAGQASRQTASVVAA
jgi:hypothetical protein